LRLIGDASIYLGSSIINKVIPFLLLPLLTKYLSPEEYGALSVYQVLIGFCIPFVGMQIHINITRNFNKYSSEELAIWVGNIFFILIASTCMVTILVFLYVSAGGSNFGVSNNWLIIVPLIGGSTAIHMCYLAVVRSQRRPFAFGLFSISNTALDMAISLCLIVYFGFGWQGRGVGIVGSALFFGLLAVYLLYRQGLCFFRLNRQKVSEALKICLPLIPHALGSAVIYLSDRLFIEQMVGKDAVGIYSISCTFGMIVSMCVESFNNAWSPWFYRSMLAADIAVRKRIVKHTYLYFIAVLVLAVLVSIGSQLVLPLMVSASYHEASQYILLIAIGFACRGMYTIVVPYLIHTGRTNFLGIGTIATALLNLMLNYFMIRANGAIGAAQATLIAFLVQFLITWAYASKVCPMPWLVWRQRNV